MMNPNRAAMPPTLRTILVIMLLCATWLPLVICAGQPVAAATPVIVQPPPGTPARTYIRRLGGGGVVAPVRAGQPVRIKIPTIGVDAVVEQVGKTPDGAMDVPHDYSETAWYDLGPRPGEPGNAVIDGHVDSTTGKAVFWDLRKLTHGDQIIVVGDDGVERHFAVSGVEAYPHTDVPLDRVFGASPGVHLNLITCDQTSMFDYTQRQYASNLVVYADAVPAA
jgi:hypothetical protein